MKQPAKVIVRDVASRTHLEFQCTQKSTPFAFVNLQVIMVSQCTLEHMKEYVGVLTKFFCYYKDEGKK
jgi:hypothetical protein